MILVWFGFHSVLLYCAHRSQGSWCGGPVHQAPLFWILALSSPCCVRPATFKVGVMGPWACDSIYSRAYPEVAASLAIARINKDPTMNQGYWFDYVILNEECQTSGALVGFINAESYASGFVGPVNAAICEAAGLLGKAWHKPILSWACLTNDDKVEHLGTLVAQPLSQASAVLHMVLKYFRWAHIGVITSEQDLWVEAGQSLANSLRNYGLPISVMATMAAEPNGAWKALRRIQRAHNIRGTAGRGQNGKEM